MPMRYVWVVVGGVIAVIVGAFLPWVTASAAFVGTITRVGTDGDGKITLALALAAGIVALVALRQRAAPQVWALAVVGVLAIVIAGIGIYDWNDIRQAVNDLSPEEQRLITASVGSGVYVTVAGAVAMFIGCVLGNADRTRPPVSGR
jgi:hypothetical protein